ncbi:MAG: glycosyltransferase family 2 protein [Paludibacteraceae bacterium]|nr:glycosyltransferase family 2 protein [Paludibacteraceae bacterium]
MISVCIATYNGEKFIKDQIDSILCQISENDEIIISDDNSTDSTLDIINSYKDNRISVYKNKLKKGYIFNFENAIKKAKGDYIFLSDQDDIWLSNKVKRLSHLLKNYDAVFSDAIVVDENLKEIYSSFFERINAKKGVFKNFYKSCYWGFGLAFKKELLELALPFPNQKEMGHDMIIGFIANIKNSIYFLYEPLTLYRRHSSTITNIANNKKRRFFVKVILGRSIMMLTILKLYIRVLFR